VKFSDYAESFGCAQLEREEGILQVTLHTDGDSLRWSPQVHRELPELFYAIAHDVDNRVVILTGTGSEFLGPLSTSAATSAGPTRMTLDHADQLMFERKQLVANLLAVDVPVIAAVNGPAVRHCELALLSDVVLVSPTVEFRDSGHLPSDSVPGDGMHVVYPLLLGTNRGRAYLLTGKPITAAQAVDFGLAFEMVSADSLLPRAWELARELITRPQLVLRFSRILLVEDIKRRMQDLLGYGLALEMLALQGRPLPAGARDQA
jgi:enoyl-CoA hydratase/carnithine racemase